MKNEHKKEIDFCKNQIFRKNSRYFCQLCDKGPFNPDVIFDHMIKHARYDHLYGYDMSEIEENNKLNPKLELTPLSQEDILRYNNGVENIQIQDPKILSTEEYNSMR